ncbi:MAG: AraC-like DNA-binding protein [Pseudohongiellaceae bacterium]|jgi:AraC-like DNA-binding protein
MSSSPKQSAAVSLNPNWTVYSTSINGVVQAARALGAPVAELLAQVGVNSALLTEAETRHPVSALYDFYQLAAACTSDDIGIFAGRIGYISRINLQLYTCGVCDTFRDYLNLMPSVLQFAGDIGEVLIRREGELIRLDWVPLSPHSARWRFQSDELLTTSAMIVDSLCVRPIPVLRAHFSYPQPADTKLLEQVFGVDLHFDQPVSCLYFDRKSLNYPLIQLDTDWSQAISRSTQYLFKGEADPVLRELRSSLVRLLPAGGLTIDKVAEVQNISRRSLQRRLAERGTQFGRVLQDLRHELALQYLSDERLSITDIAFLLGYADHGSFSKVFKAKSGNSPRDFRKR